MKYICQEAQQGIFITNHGQSQDVDKRGVVRAEVVRQRALFHNSGQQGGEREDIVPTIGERRNTVSQCFIYWVSRLPAPWHLLCWLGMWLGDRLRDTSYSSPVVRVPRRGCPGPMMQCPGTALMGAGSSQWWEPG